MGFIWIVFALIAILAIIAWIASSAASANQAQAAIEAARAAQIAAAGQTTQSVLNTVLVVVLVIVIVLAIAMIAFLFWRLNRAETALHQLGAGQQPGKWKSGSYNYWGREGDDRQLPARTDPLDQMIKLEMVKMLRERANRDGDSDKPAIVNPGPWGW